MACVLFSNKGSIKNLSFEKNDIFGTPINVFHTMLPSSKFVIYHESKTGPFYKKNDSIFSNWSKKLTNDEYQIKRLKRFIFKSIKNNE